MPPSRPDPNPVSAAFDAAPMIDSLLGTKGSYGALEALGEEEMARIVARYGELTVEELVAQFCEAQVDRLMLGIAANLES